MKNCLHHLITKRSASQADTTALIYKKQAMTYAEVEQQTTQFAHGLHQLGVKPGERVAIYLPKQTEVVFSLFATSRLAAIFVPVNPLLKAPQVLHILKDSGASILITSSTRLKGLSNILTKMPDIKVLLVDKKMQLTDIDCYFQDDVCIPGAKADIHNDCSAQNTAAILYTSGSTGKPKGIELTHENLLLGAESVNQYLNITASDRLLALLPFSFDYGLNQLISSFLAGATCVLMDYLLPAEVLKTIVRERITGLAGVPSLWIKLAQLTWPENTCDQLRYITNSGGALPEDVSRQLQAHCPDTLIYLMYGLTESFRSSYLDPALVKTHPKSIGKAIPYATLKVINKNLQECAVDEAGELIHAGPLVAKGYWNNPQATKEKFKDYPGLGRCVFSGDTVRKDKDGLLYFVGRMDEMIKTSGYRVSPTEIEDVLYQIRGVQEAAVFSISDPQTGEAIIAAISGEQILTEEKVLNTCKESLPSYMLPAKIWIRDSLPRNPNGKFNRLELKLVFEDKFSQNSS